MIGSGESAMVEKRKPRIFYGYITVAAAFVVMTVAWGANRTFGVFLEPMINEFGWTRAAISGAMTLCFAITGLLGVVAGRITDRFGPRAVATACGIFVGLGYLLLSQVQAIWQLYLFYGVVIGIGLGGTDVPTMSTVARWFVKRRGLMTGIVAAGPALGITVIPLLASWIIYSYGWRISNIVIGSMVLVLVISAAQFLRRDPAKMGLSPYGGGEVTSVEATGRELSLREVVRTSQFYLLAIIYFMSMFNINVVLVHTVIHASDVGIRPVVAATILSVVAGISIAGRIAAGVVADRIGSRKTLIIAFSLDLVAFLLLLVSKELWMFYLFALIFGLGGWAGGPMISITTAELYGTKSLGVIFAVLWGVGSIGGAVGPVVAGYIFDVSNNYQLAFIGSAGLSIVAIILASLLRRRRI